MKYGLYLTINGGEETILVGLYRQKIEALDALAELSLDKEKIRRQAKGKNVTCLEVINRYNFITEDYIPMI